MAIAAGVGEWTGKQRGVSQVYSDPLKRISMLASEEPSVARATLASHPTGARLVKTEPARGRAAGIKNVIKIDYKAKDKHFKTMVFIIWVGFYVLNFIFNDEDLLYSVK